MLRAERQEKLERMLAARGAQGTCRVITGCPGEALSELAHEVGASTIVIGPNGRSDRARVALGSEALTVIRAAPCSVLIARA